MKDEETRTLIIRLLKTIAPDTEPEQLKPDDNIRHTLNIDSFDYLQFIIGLDEALGIQTSEEDYGKVETLRTLLEYIEKKKMKM